MVGLALFLTKADGMREWGRDRETDRERKREKERGEKAKKEMGRATKRAVISLLGNTKGHNKTSPLFN